MFYAVVSSNENLCIYCFFQIYIATTKLDHFSLIIFVFVIANLPKLIYMKSVGMKWYFILFVILFESYKITASILRLYSTVHLKTDIN